MLLAGCSPVIADEFETCTVDVTLDRALGAPGDTITGTGTPFTDVQDTLVLVGGATATISEVDRSEDCYACDTCRLDAACAPCGLCSGILLDASERLDCFGDPLASPPITGACNTCTQSMSFVVPDLPPGPTTVFVLNRNGQSDSIRFTVLPAPAATTTP